MVKGDGGTEGCCRAATRRLTRPSRAKSYKSIGRYYTAPVSVAPPCSLFARKEAMVRQQACVEGQVSSRTMPIGPLMHRPDHRRIIAQATGGCEIAP
jgi:hypothetical protein